MDLAKWFRGLNPGMGYAQVIPPMPELPPEYQGCSLPINLEKFLLEADLRHIQEKVDLRAQYGA